MTRTLSAHDFRFLCSFVSTAETIDALYNGIIELEAATPKRATSALAARKEKAIASGWERLRLLTDHAAKEAVAQQKLKESPQGKRLTLALDGLACAMGLRSSVPLSSAEAMGACLGVLGRPAPINDNAWAV